MTKRIAPVMIAVLVATQIIYWWSSQREPGADARKPVDQAPTSQREKAVVVATPSVAAQSPGVPIWRDVYEFSTTDLPAFPADWSMEGRALVRVAETLASAGSWRVGDALAIPLPQLDATYRAPIEEVVNGPDESRAFTGKIVGEDGRLRRYVVTVGPSSVFAFIDTPEGSYELVGGAEFGWLVPTTSMIAGVDFSQRDYFLPGEIPSGNVMHTDVADDRAR